jgi:competence protein ComEC
MRPKLALPLLVLLVIAFILATTTLSAPAHLLQVSFINVGQGDAALVQDASGFNILIDAGLPAAGPTVVAFLREQAVDQVDVVVISHAHLDHFGGLMSVLEAPDISVREVYFNGYHAASSSWHTLATAVKEEGIDMTTAQFPREFTWAGVKGYVLGPEPGITNVDHNEASLVLLLEHGSNRFLFTGDIGFSAEATVVARGTPIAADVFKVGHHGSKNSSGEAFLAAVSPSVAIIPVGKNNYGHPSAEAIERLEAAGAQVWRTDRSGTVIVYGNGETFSIVPEIVAWVYLPLIQQGITATPPLD